MTNEELQKLWRVTLRLLAASRYNLPTRLEGEPRPGRDGPACPALKAKPSSRG